MRKILLASAAVLAVVLPTAVAHASVITECWSHCSSEHPLDGGARMVCHVRCVDAGGPPTDVIVIS